MNRLISVILLAGSLLLATLFVLSAQAQTPTLPVVTGITPNTGPADRQTPVTITGQGFTTTANVYLNGTPLLAVTFVDSTTLQARVPFGLPTGVYTLTVIIPPTGTSTPLVGTLADAFTVTAGTGNWATGGPYGGRTVAIAIHPTMTDTVFVAAAKSGLYRTTDGGGEWELVLYNPDIWNILAVWPISPTVVFVGAGDGLYRSQQGGEAGSWTLVDFGVGAPLEEARALAIAPSDPFTMYCAISSTLFHSSDGGVSWQERNTGLPTVPWHLAVDPDDAATVYASFGEAGTLYKTTNAGQLWTQLPYSIPMTTDGTGGILAIAADPYRDNTLWLGTWGRGLHRSIDGGQTFTEVISFPSPDAGISCIYFDPNRDRIYVGVSGPQGLYYSDDGGNSWHIFDSYAYKHSGADDIAVTPGDSDTIYTVGTGVRKSVDGGQTWTLTSHGIAAVQPQHIAVSPHDRERVLTVAGTDGAFGSHNSGNEWVTYLISRGGEIHAYQAAAFDFVSPTLAYIGGTETVFKTTDDGQSWQATAELPLEGLPSGCTGARPLFIAAHPQTQATVYVGTECMGAPIAVGALYRSDDGGDSWTRITAASPISAVNQIVFAPGHPEIIYLGTGFTCHWCDGHGIWRSRDGGQTWEHPTSELSRFRVLALAVSPDDPDTLLAGVWSSSATGHGIYRSTDGGDSWQPTSGLDGGVLDILYDPLNPRIVYAATYDGLRVSFDGGRSWQVYPGPMGQVPITALAVAQEGEQTYLYVGTVGGVIGGQQSTLRPAQAESIMGAGVYMGQSRWYFVHLPLVLRNSP